MRDEHIDKMIAKASIIQVRRWLRKSGFLPALPEGVWDNVPDPPPSPPGEILNALMATYPEGEVRWSGTEGSQPSFIVRTANGLEHIFKVNRDGGIEAETRPILAGAPSASKVALSPRPPLNAEFVLHLLLRREEQDTVIGDMLERYVKKHERLGERRANFWFYAEVFRSVWPLLRRAAGKVGGLALLGEWLRRITQ